MNEIQIAVAQVPAAAITELRGLLPKRFDNLNLPALSMLAHFLALYPRCPVLYSDAFKGMQAYWRPLCAAIVPGAKMWERAALTDAVQHVWAIRAQPYIDAVVRECARCGFTGSPLTETEIRNLYDCGLTEAEAYVVACDVNAGFSLEDAKAGVIQNRPGPLAEVGAVVDVRA